MKQSTLILAAKAAYENASIGYITENYYCSSERPNDWDNLSEYMKSKWCLKMEAPAKAVEAAIIKMLEEHALTEDRAAAQAIRNAINQIK